MGKGTGERKCRKWCKMVQKWFPTAAGLKAEVADWNADTEREEPWQPRNTRNTRNPRGQAGARDMAEASVAEMKTGGAIADRKWLMGKGTGERKCRKW